MQETWFRFLGREDPLEKEMAIHSCTLAWKIPWTEETDRLQSMGSQRVGHNWGTSLSLFLNINFYWSIVAFSSKTICLPRRRHVEDLGSTPGLGRFPREGMATLSSILAWSIHGLRSLVGYSPWDQKELDMTEWLTHTHTHSCFTKLCSHWLLQSQFHGPSQRTQPQ